MSQIQIQKCKKEKKKENDVDGIFNSDADFEKCSKSVTPKHVIYVFIDLTPNDDFGD